MLDIKFLFKFITIYFDIKQVLIAKIVDNKIN